MQENNKQRKIFYFINPISGTRGKESLQKRIATDTAAQNIPFEILPTSANGDYQYIIPRIQHEMVTDVVICGGDGSVNQLVNALAGTGVRFGIIPMGSGNGLALAAGIPKNPEKALQIIFNGKERATDAFRVNDQFACMLCGLGFDAQVAHEFAQQSKRGLATYASLSTRHFLAARPHLFHVEANGIRFSSEAFLVSIANSNQFGNHFTIAPKALLSDGLLDIVIVKRTAKPLLVINVIKQVLAGRLQKIENSLNSPVIYFQTKELKIENPEDAPLHIDGEPCTTARQFNISILPNHFRLIYGK